jgi:hypothetical protein
VSLTDFIKRQEVVDRIKPFRPEVRWSNFELKVSRVYRDPSLTGTAFDYLLRFELQRRAPHAKHRKWVAEQVLTLLETSVILGQEADLVFLGGKASFIPTDELDYRVGNICERARAAVDAYAEGAAPSPEGLREIAAWAARLAKIDGIYRRREVDPTFEEAPSDLVAELVDLLAVVSFDRLIHPERMLLNPTFGAG